MFSLCSVMSLLCSLQEQYSLYCPIAVEFRSYAWLHHATLSCRSKTQLPFSNFLASFFSNSVGPIVSATFASEFETELKTIACTAGNKVKWSHGKSIRTTTSILFWEVEWIESEAMLMDLEATLQSALLRSIRIYLDISSQVLTTNLKIPWVISGIVSLVI